jgi:hypothetical protein
MLKPDRHGSSPSPASETPSGESPTAAQKRAWALLDDAWREVKPLATREQTGSQPASEILNLKLRDRL